MKHIACITLCLLGLALFPGARAPRENSLVQNACLAPQLRAADGAAADLFVEKALALYPDVLAQARFAPARFAHIKSVLKTYYWFLNGQFDELYACLPEAMRRETTPEEYRALLSQVAALYRQFSPQQRAELETAVILHDIGYPGGIEREHPQRGGDLAAQILPPERQFHIPLLIRVHGIDMGVERLPDEFNAIPDLTDANKTQLFFMALFDNMGKVRSEQGAAGPVFRINNLMPPQYIRFFGAMLLCVLETRDNGPLRAFADASIDMSRDFYLFRLRSCFGYMVYSMLNDEEYRQIRETADRLLGPAVPAPEIFMNVRGPIRRTQPGTPAREIFNREWSRKIKINTFAVFLNIQKLARADRFDLIIRLTHAIARMSSQHSHGGLTVFRTDIDYLSMDVQREYREELDLLVRLLAGRKRIPLVYDGEKREIILQFAKLRTMVRAEQTQALDQAA